MMRYVPLYKAYVSNDFKIWGKGINPRNPFYLLDSKPDISGDRIHTNHGWIRKRKIIALAFLPKPPGKNIVLRINDEYEDFPENLRWCSLKEAHAIWNKRRKNIKNSSYSFICDAWQKFKEIHPEALEILRKNFTEKKEEKEIVFLPLIGSIVTTGGYIFKLNVQKLICYLVSNKTKRSYFSYPAMEKGKFFEHAFLIAYTFDRHHALIPGMHITFGDNNPNHCNYSNLIYTHKRAKKRVLPIPVFTEYLKNVR